MPPQGAVSNTIHEVAEIEGWGVRFRHEWKRLRRQDAFNRPKLPVGRHFKNIDGLVPKPDPVALVRNQQVQEVVPVQTTHKIGEDVGADAFAPLKQLIRADVP